MVRNPLTGTRSLARWRALTGLVVALVVLAACQAADQEAQYPDDVGGGSGGGGSRVAMKDSILGPNGGTIFGGSSQPGTGEPGVGVNSFLWRASLDTVSFMPLVSADPFGGVIITDWYSPP